MKKLLVVLVLCVASLSAQACPICGLGAWFVAHETTVVAVGGIAGAVSQVESMTINGVVLKGDLNTVKIQPASGVK